MISKHHPDGFRMTQNCIAMLFNYGFAHLCKYSNVTFIYTNSQVMLYIQFQMPFLLLAMGAAMRTQPRTLKLLHIHDQRTHLSTKQSFQFVWFWGNKGGGWGGWRATTKTQTPQSLRGPVLLFVIELTWKTVHTSFLWTKFWQEAPEQPSLSDLKFPVSC